MAATIRRPTSSVQSGSPFFFVGVAVFWVESDSWMVWGIQMPGSGRIHEVDFRNESMAGKSASEGPAPGGLPANPGGSFSFGGSVSGAAFSVGWLFPLASACFCPVNRSSFGPAHVQQRVDAVDFLHGPELIQNEPMPGTESV